MLAQLAPPAAWAEDPAPPGMPPLSDKLTAYDKRSDRASQWVFHDIPRHIGGDLKDTFWNGWHLVALALGSGLIVGIHGEDSQIASHFQTPKMSGFDTFASYFGSFYVLGGANLLTVLIAKAVDAEDVAVGAGIMMESYLMTMAATALLKVGVQRQRPNGGNFSFPSGHASGMFSYATVATVLYGPWVGIPSYALASAVSFSRIDNNSHYASDVLAGALLGTLLGLGTAAYHKHKVFQKYFLAPIYEPETDSVGVSIIHPF